MCSHTERGGGRGRGSLLIKVGNISSKVTTTTTTFCNIYWSQVNLEAIVGLENSFVNCVHNPVHEKYIVGDMFMQPETWNDRWCLTILFSALCQFNDKALFRSTVLKFLVCSSFFATIEFNGSSYSMNVYYDWQWKECYKNAWYLYRQIYSIRITQYIYS